MRILAAIVCAGAFIGGCAENAPNRAVIVRIDGQPIPGNPVLKHAYDVDEAICKGEMQKANLSGVTLTNGGLAGLVSQIERQAAVTEVMRGCLAQKGYVVVREDEAATKNVEFQAIAEAAAQQQLAARRSEITTGSLPERC